mgnify:CR=1 FL=1
MLFFVEIRFQLYVRPQPNRECKHEIHNENRNNVETEDVTCKTQNGGKNHDSPQDINKTTIREEYTEEPTTSRPLRHHTRRRLHRGGKDLSLSLSRSVHLTLQQQ